MFVTPEQALVDGTNLSVTLALPLAGFQAQVASSAWVLEQKLPGLEKVCPKCHIGRLYQIFGHSHPNFFSLFI